MEATCPQVIDCSILANLTIAPVSPVFANDAVFTASDVYTQIQPAKELIPCAAYDIGSGATKFMGALVDAHTHHIEQIFYNDIIPVAYRQDLINSGTNEFSDLIQDMGLTALFDAKSKIENAYVQHGLQDYGDIQHFAVATAAFREASNGQLVAEQFSQMLDFKIDIISQEDEGKLAYHGAVAQVETSDENPPIVWDIGGGSMQLTYKDVGDYFHVMQGKLASATFLNLVNEQLPHQENGSLYPMNEVNVQAAIDLAKQHLVFDQTTTDIIKQQIVNDSPILAVGSVHNFIIKPLCDLVGTPDKDSYSRQDLFQAIELLTDKSSDQIMNITQELNPEFVKSKLTNLILVYAMMEKMDIPAIQVVGVSNVEGLLAQKAKPNKVVEPFITMSFPDEIRIVS